MNTKTNTYDCAGLTLLLVTTIAIAGFLCAKSHAAEQIETSAPPLIIINNSNLAAADFKAVQDYEQHPERWKIKDLSSVGEGYLLKGQYDQATLIFQKILTEQPTNTATMRQLGICYIFAKRYDAAALIFKKGLGWSNH